MRAKNRPSRTAACDVPISNSKAQIFSPGMSSFICTTYSATSCQLPRYVHRILAYHAKDTDISHSLTAGETQPPCPTDTLNACPFVLFNPGAAKQSSS